VRRIFAAIACMALLWGLAACGAAEQTVRQTQTAIPRAAAAWYTEEGGEDGIGTRIDPGSLHVGLTYDGKRIFTFLLLPLEAVAPGSLRSARLRLKIKEGNGVPALRAGLITGPWDENTNLAQARALVGTLRPVPGFRDEGGGWCSVDVTAVLAEAPGCAPLYGIALFEARPSTETVFSASGAQAPNLEITTING